MARESQSYFGTERTMQVTIPIGTQTHVTVPISAFGRLAEDLRSAATSVEEYQRSGKWNPAQEVLQELESSLTNSR